MEYAEKIASRITREDVDKEISKVKEARQNGFGDTDFFNLKIKNLQTLKEMVKSEKKDHETNPRTESETS